MKCPRCQEDNPTHAKFCLGCGARLALACGSCGAELPGSARFCLQCGQAVAAGSAAPIRSPAPETYTPRHLAEKILTSKAALEGERKADPGSILLSPATLELAGGYVEVRSLGPVPVKGRQDPVEVFELTGAGTARSRLQATASRGLTPFVGRDPELAQLIRAQEQARGGHGQLVAIVGEAGVGKSRLYHEFTHSHRIEGWLVLQASAVSHGKSISYLPVIDLLKVYCKLEERDDHRALREKITGKLFTLDESLKPLLPAFFGLLDVPVDDPQWQALDPAQRRHQTLDANKRLLLLKRRPSRSSSSSRTSTGSTPRPRPCSIASWRVCRPRAS
jgi:hypothetical protein